MLERGDFHIMHEPFGPHYYFSTGRRTQRETGVKPQPEHEFEAIWQNFMNQQKQKPVFIKELAYQVAHRVDAEFLSYFTNTFLIRNPAQTLPSLYDKWPDFFLEEASYAEQYKVFKQVQEITGTVPVVIDADDLVTHPEATIKAYCEAVEIPFIAEAMQWESGPRPEFNWWEGGSWHTDVNASTGVKVINKKEYPSVNANEKLRDSYAYCLPYFQKMHAHRLRINDS